MLSYQHFLSKVTMQFLGGSSPGQEKRQGAGSGRKLEVLQINLYSAHAHALAHALALNMCIQMYLELHLLVYLLPSQEVTVPPKPVHHIVHHEEENVEKDKGRGQEQGLK